MATVIFSARGLGAGPTCCCVPQQALRYKRWVRLFGPTRRARPGPAGRGPGRPLPPPPRPDLRRFFGVGVGGRLRLRLPARWGLAAQVRSPAGAACFRGVTVGGTALRPMVPRGLEPRTLRLLAVRSNQLSYETLDISLHGYVPRCSVIRGPGLLQPTKFCHRDSNPGRSGESRVS